MLANVESAQPRLDGESEAEITAGELQVSPASRKVVARGQRIRLGPTEFRLLHCLMLHEERVLSRTAILRKVWRPDVVVGERTVDVHIRRLRAALQTVAMQDAIQTVRSGGYLFARR